MSRSPKYRDNNNSAARKLATSVPAWMTAGDPDSQAFLEAIKAELERQAAGGEQFNVTLPGNLGTVRIATTETTVPREFKPGDVVRVKPAAAIEARRRAAGLGDMDQPRGWFKFDARRRLDCGKTGTLDCHVTAIDGTPGWRFTDDSELTTFWQTEDLELVEAKPRELKPGDPVKIRGWNELVRLYGVDSCGDVCFGHGSVVGAMSRWCGSTVALKERHGSASWFIIDGDNWVWPEWAFDLDDSQQFPQPSESESNDMASLRHPLAGIATGPSTVTMQQSAATTGDKPAPTFSNETPAQTWARIRPVAIPEISDVTGKVAAHAISDFAGSERLRELVAAECLKHTVRQVEIKLPDAPVVKLSSAHPMVPDLVRNVALGLDTLIVGPAGAGKTFGVRQVAETLKRPLFIASSLADTFEVKGFNNAAGEFVETEASRFAECENAIMLLDEVDGYSPGPALCLNMLLSDRILVTAKGKIHVPPSNVVVATANTWGLGATYEYVGRNRLDAAFLDRFVKLKWDYDEPFERQIAMAKSGITDPRVPTAVQQIRANARKAGIKIVITPRATMAYCKLRKAGVGHIPALEATCIAAVDAAQRATLLAGVRDVENPK